MLKYVFVYELFAYIASRISKGVRKSRSWPSTFRGHCRKFVVDEMKIHKTVQNLLQRRGMYTHKLISMYRREKKNLKEMTFVLQTKFHFYWKKEKFSTFCAAPEIACITQRIYCF